MGSHKKADGARPDGQYGLLLDGLRLDGEEATKLCDGNTIGVVAALDVPIDVL